MGMFKRMQIDMMDGSDAEAEAYEAITDGYKKLAAAKRMRKPYLQPNDRLTDTYETDESLAAKDGRVEEEEEEAPTEQQPEPEKTVAKPTLVEVRKKLAELSREGHTAEVRTLIVKFGADKLSAVKEEDYPALLKEAEGIVDGRE